jgi:broad specificity phosphatase PhoE
MIIVIRHGQDQDNAQGILNGHRDLPLTEVGRAQMLRVAAQLEGVSIDVILTSPLQRAVASANIIARHLHYPTPIHYPDLIERDFGCLTGKAVAEIAHNAPTILPVDGVNYFLDAPGAEGFPTLLCRAQRVLKDLQTSYPGKDLLLVTHGDLAKMLRAAYDGWDWERGLRSPYLDNAGLICLPPPADVTLWPLDL